MSLRIKDVLVKETGAKRMFPGQRHSLDTTERPTIDYGRDGATWEQSGETERTLKGYRDLSERCDQLNRYEVPDSLVYFLDGSRHVYKVDDIAFSRNKRISVYPVLAGQIGVGCCVRHNRTMKKHRFFYECVLALPDLADADGRAGFSSALVQKLNELEVVRRRGIHFGHVFFYDTSKPSEEWKQIGRNFYESRGTAKIQEHMIGLEQEMVRSLVKEHLLDQDHYLIKDGSLEYRGLKRGDAAGVTAEMLHQEQYEWVLGVSKNFNPEVCKDQDGKPNPGFIAELPFCHRTPAAMYEWGGVRYAVWYLRLREAERTRSIFDGVVKVEKVLVGDEIENGMETERIDDLSARILNERNPVCYGSDLRWANHLYPIYLTEQFVKARYIPNESFLQMF